MQETACQAVDMDSHVVYGVLYLLSQKESFMKLSRYAFVLLTTLLLIAPMRSDAQWTQVNTGLGGPSGGAESYIPSLAAKDTNLYAGTSAGIFRSNDDGSNWRSVGINSSVGSAFLYSLCVDSTTVYAGAGNYGGVYYSSNSGLTWSDTKSGTTFFSLTLGPRGAGVFAGTHNGVLVSTNKGSTWASVSTGMTNYTNVYSMTTVDTVLLAGTFMRGMYRSTNNGTTWTAADSGLEATTTIRAFATLPNGVGGANVYAANDTSGVFVSTDNGQSWAAANSGMGNIMVSCLASYDDGGSAKDLFAGTYDGKIFMSTNLGASWTDVSAGLPSTSVVSLAVSHGYLIAGTNNAAAWRRSIAEMLTGVAEGTTAVPAAFHLSQNYPNPFNPSTEIRYTVGQTGYLSLAVYNILGQKVATLFEGVQQAGEHRVRFDGSALANGVYFCRLKAAGFVAVTKLMLLK